MGEIWTPESKKLGEIWTPDLKRGRYEPRTGGVMSRGRYENAPKFAQNKFTTFIQNFVFNIPAARTLTIFTFPIFYCHRIVNCTHLEIIGA